jgi:hypothetical protein
MEPPETKLHYRVTDGTLWLKTAFIVFLSEVKHAPKTVVLLKNPTAPPARRVKVPLEQPEQLLLQNKPRIAAPQQRQTSYQLLH